MQKTTEENIAEIAAKNRDKNKSHMDKVMDDLNANKTDDIFHFVIMGLGLVMYIFTGSLDLFTVAALMLIISKLGSIYFTLFHIRLDEAFKTDIVTSTLGDIEKEFREHKEEEKGKKQ